jgi:ribosome-binding factor A
MSQRSSQVESTIARVLSNAIHELNDPRLPIVITIDRVQISTDLMNAKVFVSGLGEVAPMLEALNGAKGLLQRAIAREVRMKRTPLLEFLDAANNFL